MRWFRFTTLLIIVSLLQSGLIDLFAVTTIKPDVLLILLVFYAVYSDTKSAIIASFAIGFTADLIGPAMGPQMLSYGIFGTLLVYMHRYIAIRNMPHQSLAICITGFCVGTLSLLLTIIKGPAPPSGNFVILLGSSLYSGLVGPFLFLPYAWWMKVKTHRFSKS